MKSIWKNSVVILFTVFLFNALFFGCSRPLRPHEFDLAKQYRVNGLVYDINFSCNSINDSISRANLQINPNDLLFSKTKSDSYIARYTIGYKIFKSYKDKEPIDTATIHYSMEQSKKSDQKIHNINFFAPVGKIYIVEFFLRDENRNHTTSKIKIHRKKTTNDRSYFRICSLKKGIINNTFYQKDSFSLILPDNFKNALKVMTFQYKSTCAARPYEVNYSYRLATVADSSWVVSNKKKYNFPPLKNGYYFFVTDTLSKEGFSVFSINQSFPKINSFQDANTALGYLLSKSEYADLLRNNNQRMSFENQWLKLAGNRYRARNLIKNYYSEVSNANKLFTNNQPGWSTDQGMIYIIYGPPPIVYRNDNSEIWIYGEENNLFSEEFEFQKINSNVADNIYELKRNINFKISFNKMVNAWIDERGY